MQKAHLKRSRRILHGHLWVFSNEIEENLRDFAPGSPVQIFDRKDTFIGSGYINPKSLIAVRVLTRENIPLDRAFFSNSLRRAIELRRRILGDAAHCRLVFSEADYLPGLIVDRYGSCLVVQLLTAGMEQQKDHILDLLDELLSPETIVVRNDSRSRLLEGLPQYKELRKGSLEHLPVIDEGGVRFTVDPMEGQKTGFFLDQRENRAAFSKLVKQGRGLDLFCHTGSWSLTLAAAGNIRVTGVDSSERAIRQAEQNAAMNNLQEKAGFVISDVFDFLKKQEETGAVYDFIVCDPPAFVKSASKVKEAVRAYTELNAACLRLLKPGGLLATSSCSYHLQKGMFMELLLAAAHASGRSLRLLSLRSQAMDHPVLLAMPETEYLKCAFLVVD
ncbi:MAG: rRNA large subunit methyltransferase I [Thermodesulfovibrio sp.]|nr:rRNA large subunit methyltransferase I [Thermodesulfovibrio sp.]